MLGLKNSLRAVILQNIILRANYARKKNVSSMVKRVMLVKVCGQWPLTLLTTPIKISAPLWEQEERRPVSGNVARTVPLFGFYVTSCPFLNGRDVSNFEKVDAFTAANNYPTLIPSSLLPKNVGAVQFFTGEILFPDSKISCLSGNE